jgi:hypothetical protein
MDWLRMTVLSICTALVMLLLLAPFANPSERPDPCAATDATLRRLESASSSRERCSILREAAEVAGECPGRAGVLMRTGRCLRDQGDSSARRFYEDAVAAAPDDAGAALEVGDYLRVYRGPLQPLFPEAEDYYYRARRAVAQGSDDPRITAQLTRSLAALYERDGIAILHRRDLPGLHDDDPERPVLFLSTQLRVGRLLDDFEQPDAVRDLTATALLAGIRQQPPRALTRAELDSLVEPHAAIETLNRLRLRYGAAPSVDLTFAAGHADDAQTTVFAEPGTFNDVDARTLGLGIERTFDASPIADIGVRLEVARGDRQGLVEFLPHAHEHFDSIGVSSIVSRFVGTAKVSLDTRYFFTDFDQKVASPIDRSLQIVAATLRYQQYTPGTFERLFDLRTSELFAGIALGEEIFGDVHVERGDYFAGVAARGLPPDERLDIVVQPTLFDDHRTGHESDGTRAARLHNQQYRTAITVLYRLRDFENMTTLEELPHWGPAHLAFLHLVMPLAHDLAVHGPSDFESIQAGIELAAKLIGTLGTEERLVIPTVLATIGYSYHGFYRLRDRDAHLAQLDVALGF